MLSSRSQGRSAVPALAQRTKQIVFLSFFSALSIVIIGFVLADNDGKRKSIVYGVTLSLLFCTIRLLFMPLLNDHVPDYANVRGWRDHGSFSHKSLVTTQQEWQVRKTRRTLAVIELCLYWMGACVTGMVLGAADIDARIGLNTDQKNLYKFTLFFSLSLVMLALPVLAFGYKCNLPDCLKAGKFINALTSQEGEAVEISQQRDTLMSIAKEQNCDYQDVVADGNCFFRAVVAALSKSEAERTILEGRDHVALREKVMNFLRTDDTVTVRFPNFGVHHPEGIGTYIENMSKDRTWVDATTVQATAMLLNIDIEVFTAAEGRSITIRAGNSAPASAHIRLGNLAERHYICFLDREPTPTTARVARLPASGGNEEQALLSFNRV